MIKFIMPNTDISTIEPDQLKYLDWAALSGNDIKNSPTEFISKNFSKLSACAKRVVIAEGKIGPDAMTDKEWVAYFSENYIDYAPAIFQQIQFNYSTLVALLNDNNNRYIYSIARTQHHLPIGIIIENYKAANLAIRNGNIGVIDYIRQHKNELGKGFLNRLQYLKSTEAKELGLIVKNRKISAELLERAGACSTGTNYFKRILKQVDSNKTSITWNEIIDVLRTNKKYKQNDTFIENIEWLVRAQHMDDL